MDDNSQVTDVPDKSGDFRHAKRKCLVALLAIAAFFGFLQGLFPMVNTDDLFSVLEVLGSLALVIIAMVWCYIDAEEYDFAISLRLSVLLFMLLPVGFLYYILKTRKNGPALKVLGLAFLVLLLWGIIYAIALGLGCVISGNAYPD